jgi:hypothetical protein
MQFNRFSEPDMHLIQIKPTKFKENKSFPWEKGRQAKLININGLIMQDYWTSE